MTISKEEVVALPNAFHDVSTKGGAAADQAKFFLYPEPRIFVPHGEDLTLQANYEIHLKLTDERHIAAEQWETTPLNDSPERTSIPITTSCRTPLPSISAPGRHRRPRDRRPRDIRRRPAVAAVVVRPPALEVECLRRAAL
jgi:hypothetical protein